MSRSRSGRSGLSSWARHLSAAPRSAAVRRAAIAAAPTRRVSASIAWVAPFESLEVRALLSAAFDITHLTQARQDPAFTNINGQGVGVAILDTGVFGRNPDLAGNLSAFYNAVEQPVDAPIDPNFLNDSTDAVGHGSHTSGTAASNNPDIGVAYKAKLVDVKVFQDPGEPMLAGDPVIRGLQWVLRHYQDYNIKAINMSLGDGENLNTVPPADAFGQAIQDLEAVGVTVVSSSGNSYANDPVPGAAIPAVYSTISVGNIWSDNGRPEDFGIPFGGNGDLFFAIEHAAHPDLIAATSQRSTLSNQLLAPGSDIFSTWNSPTQLHNVDSGTSMSAPFVTGTVALMQQAAKTFGGRYISDPFEILRILRDTADPIVDTNVTTNSRVSIFGGPEQDLPETGQTFYRINVYAALQRVRDVVTQSGTPGVDLDAIISRAIVTPPLTGATQFTDTGTVGDDGLHLVGGKDVDLYKLNLQSRGDLLVRLTPGAAPVGAILRLFDSSGNLIDTGVAGNDGVATIITQPNNPLPVGTYYVGVSSSNNNAYDITTGAGTVNGTSEGDYSLNVNLRSPDPNGTLASAIHVNLADTNAIIPGGNTPAVLVSGSIGSDAPTDGSTSRVVLPDGDVDMYRFVAQDDGTVTASATSGFAAIQVFDENGNPIGTQSQNGFTASVLQGHAYYVSITSPFNSGFNPNDPYGRAVGSTTPEIPYDLYMYFSNGDINGTAPEALDQPIGTPVNERIGADHGTPLFGVSGGAKDVDFFRFTAPSDGVFDVSAAGTGGFKPSISFWTPGTGIDGISRLANADPNDAHLIRHLAAGESILVAVTGTGNNDFNGHGQASGSGGQTGNYTLTTALRPTDDLRTLANDSIQNNTPQTLTVGSPIPGNIGRDADLYVGPTDVDMYSFTPTATRDYLLSTNATQDNSADTVLRVFDADGNPIAVNDNANATTTSSAVTVGLEEGKTYYIGVNGAGPNAFAYNPKTGANPGVGSQGNYTISAADAGPFTRTSNFSSGHKLTYTDANGAKVIVTLTGPGTGQVVFGAPGNANAQQIILDGTTAKSNVTIKGVSSVGGITVNGSLHTLNARAIDVTGDTNVTGSLANALVRSDSGGHIFQVGSGTLSLVFGSVTDMSLTSGGPIRSLKVIEWLDTDATRDVITASSLASLVSKGNFQADLHVDTLGKVTIGGALTGSDIRATSSIASITASSMDSDTIFAGIRSDLNTLPSTAADFANANGLIKAITVRGKAADAFSNTLIAANTINTASLSNVKSGNNGQTFGVAARQIKSFRAITATGILNEKKLTGTQSIALGTDGVLRTI